MIYALQLGTYTRKKGEVQYITYYATDEYKCLMEVPKYPHTPTLYAYP